MSHAWQADLSARRSEAELLASLEAEEEEDSGKGGEGGKKAKNKKKKEKVHARSVLLNLAVDSSVMLTCCKCSSVDSASSSSCTCSDDASSSSASSSSCTACSAVVYSINVDSVYILLVVVLLLSVIAVVSLASSCAMQLALAVVRIVLLPVVLDSWPRIAALTVQRQRYRLNLVCTAELRWYSTTLAFNTRRRTDDIITDTALACTNWR
jgi:hypothetical protein